MKKIKIGIVGYGGLGHAVEQEAKNRGDVKLVTIFSRREVESPFGTAVLKPEKISEFKNKIDVLILCGGSQNDMLIDAPRYLKEFNIINTFDTHKLVPREYEKLNKIAVANEKTGLICAGWDPGLFSVLRALLAPISDDTPACFYGKGISLGHSQAVKRINCVKDAISFTFPDKNALKNAKSGVKGVKSASIRKVFVVANGNYDAITDQILNMPNYFKGEKTEVTFVSEKELARLKTAAHCGEIVSGKKEAGYKHFFNFKLKTTSNARLTAKIVLAYAAVFDRLEKRFGNRVITPLHIPPIMLLRKPELQVIKEFV